MLLRRDVQSLSPDVLNPTLWVQPGATSSDLVLDI